MLLFQIEAGVCLLFTLYLYFRFAMKGLRYYVTILNILVWFFTFLMVVLIPFDILLNSRLMKGQQTEQIEEDLYLTKIAYNVIYWTIYVLSWIVIPLAQEYEKAGDFTVKERLLRALKTNLITYLIIIISGVVFICYLMVKEQLTGAKLTSFLIMLSNIWGIFIIVFMLGYGLVAVPKHVLKISDYKTRKDYLEFCAGECKEKLVERNLDMINCVQRLRSTKNLLNKDRSDNSDIFRGYADKMWLDLNDYHSTVQDSFIEDELKQYSNKFSQKELIKLNKHIKRNRYDILRLRCEMEEVYKEWHQLQNMQGIFKSGYDYERNWWTKTVKFYYLRVRPWLLKILAVILIILSLSTLISEITLFIEVPLSIFGLLIERSDNIYIMNLLCLIPMCFLFLTSLYGLFNIKLTGFYSIHDNRHTDSTSLLFIANFMCRIGFPLCLNFVQMLKLGNVKTVIEGMMGQSPDAGKDFLIFFPAILIILCLFNLSNIYGRIMNFLGFSTFSFKTSETEEKIEEGREVLDKMRISNEKEMVGTNNVEYNSSRNDLKSNLILREDSSVKLIVSSPSRQIN